MKPHEQAVYRFGTVLVPSERRLLRDGKSVAMTGRAFGATSSPGDRPGIC
jgi:hypothetical protein